MAQQTETEDTLGTSQGGDETTTSFAVEGADWTHEMGARLGRLRLQRQEM